MWIDKGRYYQWDVEYDHWVTAAKVSYELADLDKVGTTILTLANGKYAVITQNDVPTGEEVSEAD